jgi:hypothetical protein
MRAVTPIGVVAKPAISEEIQQDIVKELKEALLKAEAGSISAVMVVTRNLDETWSSKRSGCMNFPDAMGRLHIAIHAWINDYLREEK